SAALPAVTGTRRRRARAPGRSRHRARARGRARGRVRRGRRRGGARRSHNRHSAPIRRVVHTTTRTSRRYRTFPSRGGAPADASPPRIAPTPLPRQLEPHPLGADDPRAEVLGTRLLVPDDAAPGAGGHTLLPQTAQHRVAAGAVAVEVVEALPHHGAARRPAEARHAVPGEERAERVVG